MHTRADGQEPREILELAWPPRGWLLSAPGSSEAVPSFPPSRVNEEKEMKSKQTYVHVVCVHVVRVYLHTHKYADFAGVLVSLSVGSKWPHSEWLDTGVSSLTVLEAGRNQGSGRTILPARNPIGRSLLASS